MLAEALLLKEVLFQSDVETLIGNVPTRKNGHWMLQSMKKRSIRSAVTEFHRQSYFPRLQKK